MHSRPEDTQKRTLLMILIFKIKLNKWAEKGLKIKY
jgi:hypothetical protein